MKFQEAGLYLYYKGYKIYESDEDGDRIKNLDFKKSDNGLILINEVEQNNIQVIYEGTNIQKYSKMISEVTIIFLMCIIWKRYLLNKQKL